jgi:hypothetical protein
MESDLRNVKRKAKQEGDEMFAIAYEQPLKTLEEREMEENALILPDKPIQADRDWVAQYCHKANPDAWQEYDTKECDYKNRKYKKEWRLKDEIIRDEYADKSGRVNAYDDKKHWQQKHGSNHVSMTPGSEKSN